MAKVLIMMSGGVDSSVAAALLKEAGHEVTGVTLRLADAPPDSGRVGGCCSLGDVEDARCVARFLGIPHYSLNEKDLFQRTVLRNFAEEYRSGRTPNPCYRCNQWIKFDHVLRWGRELGFEAVATGHYARIEWVDGQPLLARGLDRNKDQTYFLASIRPEVLPRLLFPIGDLTKGRVRELAAKFGLITAEKEESQELCFAHDLDYRSALEPGAPGEIVDEEGNLLGVHEGIARYTIGQRKGIGLSGGPFYVIRLEPETGRVVVGGEEDLFAEEVEADELNAFRPLREGEILTAHPRYRHPGVPARVEGLGVNSIRVRFLSPERALTPGQALALYEGDRLIAGAVIRKVAEKRGAPVLV
ncbi:MAG: tRNA 2-thiouridine(34) synthase MnmA [Candidatus Omnitrophica bacterium]|nr:tRNA 2-thiouridine(34) synthase MnmA [Candidatus Omnitrophota bacterium]